VPTLLRSKRPRLLLAVLLLALALFQAAGWWYVWRWARDDARQAAQRAMALPETPLVQRTLSRADLEAWRFDKKELRLEGRLYDIRSEQARGDSVLLMLYHDRREEALMHALYTGWLPGEHPHDAPARLHLWLLRCLFMPFELPSGPTLAFIGTARRAPAVFTYHLSGAQYVPGLVTPPPESGSPYML
jgi:cbb3-type cytochrome oxidase subunit 3